MQLCKTDPRATWRGLTIATDLEGNRVWSRVDTDTRGEYGFTDSAGKIVSVGSAAESMSFDVYNPFTEDCNETPIQPQTFLSQVTTDSALSLFKKNKEQKKKIAQIKDMVADL
jgi:hypothetical protein